MMFARGCLIAFLLVFGPHDGLARGKDPRVPPGTDPGGVAVALISAGIDYTLPQIAGRLARDGEGDVIGWDFVDGDALPFAPADGEGPSGATALASAILAEAPAVRLVPVRVDIGQAGSVSKALAFVAKTPARAVLLTALAPNGDWGLFRLAAREFKQLLIVVPADPAAADLDNVLLIESPDNAAAESADTVPSLELASAANAIRIAAEAAAGDPSLDGAGLKHAVLERQAGQEKRQ